MRQAQAMVGKAADLPENLRQARSAAEAIITAFYAEVGWQVQVRWLDDEAGKGQPLIFLHPLCGCRIDSAATGANVAVVQAPRVPHFGHDPTE